MFFCRMHLLLATKEKIEKLEISVIGHICHDLGVNNFHYSFAELANIILKSDILILVGFFASKLVSDKL